MNLEDFDTDELIRELISRFMINPRDLIKQIESTQDEMYEEES